MNRKIATAGALLATLLVAGSPQLGAQTAGSSPTTTKSKTEKSASDTTTTTQSQAPMVPETTTASNDNNQPIITLDPFTVNSSTDEGYRATETLAGARVKTKIKDTPSALSIINKQFMQDTGITNAQELLVYTADTSVAGLGGNYSGVSARGIGVGGNAEHGRLKNPSSANRARGLTPMDNTRNYFTSEIPWDSYDISRVTISRGPNSFLFGVGSPSGVSNYSTNAALFKDQGSLELRLGSYGSHREALDYNKVLLDNQLAVRVDLLNDDTSYRQRPAYNHAKRGYAALRYDPKFLNTSTNHLSIRFNAEYGRVRSNNPRELPPMDFITGAFDGKVNKSGYDPFIYNTGQGLGGVGSFQGTANPSAQAPAPALSPWVNGEDYHYIWPGPGAAYWYDGQTGALLQAMTTFNGAVNVNGGTNNFASFPQAAALYTSGFTNYAKTVDYLAIQNGTTSPYPGAYAGTIFYNDKSLMDPSIFNFYDKLIDGTNKQEWQNWHAFNTSIDDNMLNGRFSIQAVYDYQDYDDGQAGMFGYTEPFISVDLDSNQIMYPSWYPDKVVPNTNVGRPFVASDTGTGDNSSHYTHNNFQVTANADLRFSDFVQNDRLARILGHHSFTVLGGQYTTNIETRAWAGYATDIPFVTALQASNPSLAPKINNRYISWVSYLGSSIANTSSASGLNLGNMGNAIVPTSGSIMYFDNTWTPSTNPNDSTYVDPGATWVDPSPYAATMDANATQAQNPANYKGWTTMPVNVLNWHDNINQLYQQGTKVEQRLKSVAFMYQGHFLDDTILPMWGYRRDRLSQWSSNAPLNPTTSVANMNYGITGGATLFTTTSKSYGVTLHLPKSWREKLPFGSDVSLYYFHGQNETPKVRYAFDATQLPSESGKTDDYSLQLDTFHGRFSLRLTKFKTLDKNGAAGSGAADPLGNNGYLLYLLPAWGAADAAASGLEQTNPGGGGGFANNSGDTAAQAAAVAAFKSDFAKYFPQSFFDSYGLGVNVNAITSGDWAKVYNDPSNYPYPWTISNTGGGHINGSFPIITQNSKSTGYELEATLRPVPNWNITFNATEVSSVQTALGSQDTAFIQEEYKFFSGPAGQLPLWGYWGGAGGGTSTLEYSFLQNIWSAYQLQQAQNGSEAPEVSKWHFNAVMNYAFQSGFLKGFNLGGGFRWQSKPILGYGASQVTDPVSGAQSWQMDVNKPIRGVAETHIDMWVGYKRKLTDKIDWKIQLNLRDINHGPHLVPVSVEPDGTPAQMRIEEGFNWYLTNTFSF